MSDQLPKPCKHERCTIRSSHVHNVLPGVKEHVYTQSQLVAIIEQVIGIDDAPPLEIPELPGFKMDDLTTYLRNKLREEQRKRLQDLID